ncbi:MAG TPA: sterol desaturase family protein [Ohtaekwangia sp.]|uniref:sterol desaturase family protein n=1 Tax=Ohtaekwangia sp. TaxID=2066019 RepID=UPI002F93C028
MDQKLNLVAFIIPAFFLFLALEYLLARKRGKSKYFTYENSIANISIGIAERLLNLLITGSFYSLFYYIYQHYALFNIPNRWPIWIALLLTTDLIWYWYHRLGHEINVMWGAHIVHHHSEDFNYTVSARITTLQAVIRNLFWCILPFIGFHPAMVIAILVVHGTYSFFTHTQLIGKLGFLEYILITPSHHRVHHASNEKYLNKNYGDIFIFWDKLFGTFQKEEEEPVYGLTHPLKRHSFLWQHFHYYFELAEACRRSGSIVKSLRIIFGKPEDIDQTIREDLENALLPPRINFRSTFRFKVYLNLQLLASILGLFSFTLFFFELDVVECTLIIALILITLINCGALLEQQQWIYFLEIARLLIACSYISYLSESFGFFCIGTIGVLVIATMNSFERMYFRFVYDEQ